MDNKVLNKEKVNGKEIDFGVIFHVQSYSYYMVTIEGTSKERSKS